MVRRHAIELFGRGRFGSIVLPLLVGVAGLATFVACGASTLINPPVPEVVGTRADNGQVNLDYTVWVYCTVYNDGGGGEIEVSATLNDGGGSWKKRTTMQLDSEEEQEHKFTFPEIEYSHFGSYEFACQAVPK